MSKEKAHEYLKSQIALMVVDLRDNVKQGAAYPLEDIEKAIDIASTPQWTVITDSPETMPPSSGWLGEWFSPAIVNCTILRPMNIFYVAPMYHIDGKWHDADHTPLLDVTGNQFILDGKHYTAKVIAWQPLPEPYKPENI